MSQGPNAELRARLQAVTRRGDSPRMINDASNSFGEVVTRRSCSVPSLALTRQQRVVVVNERL